MKGRPYYLAKYGVCCRLVRALEGMNAQMMECVVGLLTDRDTKNHDEEKIRKLGKGCKESDAR
jgi:hypothetical protein